MERSPADVYTEHLRRRELAYQVDDSGAPVAPAWRDGEEDGAPPLPLMGRRRRATLTARPGSR